jgi:hypothetical protein
MNACRVRGIVHMFIYKLQVTMVSDFDSKCVSETENKDDSDGRL